MGMNIQKSAGVKADTFILKRNNMDRWIRMDVAMLIILAICTRGNRRNNSGSKRCSGSKRRESCMGKYGLRENRDHNAGNSYG